MNDMTTQTSPTVAERQIAVWLLVCCALVFCMVVLGGATRLTGSGLSMVNWRPITGVIPPLTEAAWEEEFAAYRQSPEFQKVNVNMDLEGFKGIFWLEFFHRLLGRAVGVVFLVPFLYFWMRRKLSPDLVPKLLIMFALGGAQGVLGWYMVKSGLVDNPHVSQYRLAAHLTAAVIIYVYMLWVALSLLSPQPPSRGRGGAGLRRFGLVVSATTLVAMVSGAFVAGLRAGYAYNTFPKMGDQWIPDGMWLAQIGPWYMNLFENIVTVQFNHRVLAILTLVLAFIMWLKGRDGELARRTSLALYLALGLAMAQVALGVSTLLLHVPVVIATAHQGCAVLLLTALVYLNHELRPVEG